MSWLISKALMNSLSLQEQVAEYLGENFLDGEQSAPLSGSNIQQAYCAPDKMTGFSRLSRFGMTYKPLTGSRGEELLTLYRVGFHAKTSPLLEKEQELMESEAECGEKWHASFTKYDPDSSLWKTHQCSLAGDLEEFSETWPQWGLMRDGECWEQRTLEQTIRGTGFGLSPDGKATFHTPNTTGLDGGSNSRKELKKKQENWPTPDANCGMRGTQDIWTPKRKSGHQAQYSINQAVRDAEKIKWPTPRCQMTRELKIRADIEKGHKRNLEEVVALREKFPTPTAHMAKETNAPSEALRNEPSMASRVGGKLNPTWVEWLMGWPLGWTDLKPLATDKCHSVLQQLGEF